MSSLVSTLERELTFNEHTVDASSVSYHLLVFPHVLINIILEYTKLHIYEFAQCFLAIWKEITPPGKTFQPILVDDKIERKIYPEDSPIEAQFKRLFCDFAESPAFLMFQAWIEREIKSNINNYAGSRRFTQSETITLLAQKKAQYVFVRITSLNNIFDPNSKNQDYQVFGAKQLQKYLTTRSEIQVQENGVQVPYWTY